MRDLEVRNLGLLPWSEAWELQQQLAERRKRDEISDQLLLVEHPHVVTMGRNGKEDHVLASPDILQRSGIAYHETNRGGDATYHGPGQIVGYPILDLREWKRDVVAYVRAIEQVVMQSLASFGIAAERREGASGVWTRTKEGLPGKICAIGVHLSRWVTSHGFALNHSTDLSYFRYIVPCGLTLPVTSMQALGVDAPRATVEAALIHNFRDVFYPVREPQETMR
jgi:lipoyl(octanoyl) transferase